MTMIKICPTCGKEFTTNNESKIFCQSKCWKKSYSLICKTCGKEFLASSKKVLYCSKECREQNKPKSELIKTCEICGKEFKGHHRDSRFCSKECVKLGKDLILQRRRETCIKKYGKDSVMKVKEVREKIENTFETK